MNPEFWQSKKILITGVSGFVGSHFFKELTANAEYVIGTSFKGKKAENIVSLDLLEKEGLQKLCEDREINTLIHCAALDGNAEFKTNNSARIMEENVQIVTNILNVSKNSGVRDVVILSSAEIYAPTVESPIKESDDFKRFFHHSGNGYVQSKIFAEIMGNMFTKQFGFNTYFPRPTNIYGPGDRFEVEANRVIPSMIRKVLAGEKVEIWGDGGQIRSFIHVQDMVRMVLAMVETKKYQTLNISTSESISIIELAKLISNISSSNLDLELLMDRPSGIKKRMLDSTKVFSIIDFEPRSLRQGLKETIDWYRQNFLTN